MTNFNELCAKNTEEFISKTLVGLKAIKREASKAIKEIKEYEECICGGESDE